MNGALKGICDVSYLRSREESAVAAAEALRWPAAKQTETSGEKDRDRRAFQKIVSGVAEANPALVLTATVAGAVYHYSLLWSVLLAAPILISVFAVSRRIRSETGQGLIELLRRDYGQAVAIGCAAIVLAINMALIVADFMAVTEGFSMILELPRMFFVAAAAFSVWYILIFRDYRRITRIAALLALPLLIYFAAVLLARPSWPQVLYHSVVPGIPPVAGYPIAFIAILGSLLTPYVLGWQSGSPGSKHRPGIGDSGHRASAILTTCFCFVIMIAAGKMLSAPDADSVTARMAAGVLAPAVGPGLATVVFALGMIGAGMAALPALIAAMCNSASQAMGWRSGLDENPWEAKRFYVLISCAVFVAGAFSFVRINTVSVLYWSQILAGVLTLPVMGFVLLVANSRRLMRTANSWWQNFWIGAGGGSILCAALLAFWWQLLR